MPTKRLLSGLFCLFATASYVAVMACGSTDFSGQDGGSSNNVVSGGDSCDGTLSPAQNVCVVSEAFGIFVAPNGNAVGADGTRAKPYATLQAGIGAAKAAKKRVYACVGTYAEQITLADGVSIFGDLDCTQSWIVVAQHASVKAPTSPAARADQIQDPTRIDSVDFVAPDGTAATRSSIALLVTGSPGLTVANATIHAGNGYSGEDGVAGIQLAQTDNPNGGQNPANASCETATICPPNGHNGAGSICSYPDGGVADDGAFNGGPGGSGGTGGACLTAGFCVVGGVSLACCTTPDYGPGPAGAPPSGTPSQPGTVGTSGADAAPGGTLSATGYVPADGTDGKNGGPGNGGSGSMGDPVPVLKGHSASGLSGGAGGCPGLAGTAGKGGGASIVVLVSNGAMTFDTCTLQASNGGNAGKGTFGSNPTNGGTGGTSGGNGGDSGWSGNGSAGPSYGIAIHGAAPVLKSSTPKPGAGGHGVAVQTSGAKTIPATPDGAAAATVTF